MKRYNIPFSYITSCDIDEPKFKNGFDKFLSVVTMAKNFFGLRVVQVGTRVKPFKCVMANELELTEKFGIEVVPVNMAEASIKFNAILNEKKDVLSKHVSKIKAEYDINGTDEATLTKTAAFIEFYKEILDENMGDVISTECWTVMNLAFGAMPCHAMSILADMGYIVVCESDIHGAITAALLSSAARGKKPPFFGEFTVRHPSKDNAELLWHCGVFAGSLKNEGEKPKLVTAKPNFCVRDGEYTIARFQAEKGEYYLLGDKFKTTQGPATTGTYLWAKFENLDNIEKKLVEGPYIHHMSEISGDYVAAIEEFTKYVQGLIYDRLN